VVEDDVIAQLETDKVTMDIKYQQKTPGVVKSIEAAEGDTVTVGQAFAFVEEGAEAAAGEGKPAEAAAEAAPKGEAEAPKAAAPKAEASKPAAAAKPAAPAPPKPAAAAGPPPTPAAPGQRPERRVPMTRLRRRVAERLKGAQNTYAMLSTFNEVDMTNVMEMRKELKVGGWAGTGRWAG
jgi:2-oxoglutarate dehydrogenase E2 component (dihydrolipoamide succinyltransferase)